MGETIQVQVGRWVDGYERRLEAALSSGFPEALEIYRDALQAEGPNIVTRPIHSWSKDVTIHLYAFDLQGRHRAILHNNRLRKLGESGGEGRGATSTGRTAAPKGSRFRSLPVGPRKVKDGDRDVSGLIDKGYTPAGARTARPFKSRGIGDSYHEHAWRKALPLLYVYWLRHIVLEVRHG